MESTRYKTRASHPSRYRHEWGEGHEGMKEIIEENKVVDYRIYFSNFHKYSAQFLAEQAGKIENEKCDDAEKLFQHRAYVIGSILSSVTFLETNINELYSDANHYIYHNLKGLSDEVIGLMRRLWDRGIPRTARFSIIEKYEVALDLVNKSFDRSGSVFNDAKALIYLRNELVHTEPEWQNLKNWIPKSQKDMHKIEKWLRHKFPLNKLAESHEPFFPNKCLGVGCAKWATNAILNFNLDFCNKMGIDGQSKLLEFTRYS